MTVMNPVTVLYFAALVTGLDGTILGAGASSAETSVGHCTRRPPAR